MSTVTRDFDAERREKPTKEFVLGGETFTLRRTIRPEVMTDFEDLDPTTPAVETMKIVDRLIQAFILPEQADTWDRVRASDDPENAVGLDDLMDVTKWCIGEVTGRNPTQPSSSISPPGEAGTPSTDDSRPEGQTSGHLISVGS